MPINLETQKEILRPLQTKSSRFGRPLLKPQRFGTS